jgi:hypothetical protein
MRRRTRLYIRADTRQHRRSRSRAPLLGIDRANAIGLTDTQKAARVFKGHGHEAPRASSPIGYMKDHKVRSTTDLLQPGTSITDRESSLKMTVSFAR